MRRMRSDRYVLRPMAMCCLLAFGGLVLLGGGSSLVMKLTSIKVLMGLLLLFLSGLLFFGVYLLGRCAVIIDEEGVRLRKALGGWRRMRWAEAAEVTRRYVPQRGRAGGYTMLVVITRDGERFEVLKNDQTLLLLLQKYCPVPVGEPEME